MIHWTSVAINALWITGLATLLAAFSRASWLAAGANSSVRSVLVSPPTQTALDLGFVLVCAGLGLSADATWQRLVWAALALLYAGLGWTEWRRGRTARGSEIYVEQSKNKALYVPRKSAIPDHTSKTRSERNKNEELYAQRESLTPDRGPVTRAERPRFYGGWLATAVQHVELWWVLAAVPFLIFPSAASPWAAAAITLLWLLRRLATGRLTVRTPSDVPILVILLLLPVALWASANTDMTYPALYRLIAGIALYYAVVNWTVSSRRLAMVTALTVMVGIGLAAIVPFATTFQPFKLFATPPVLTEWLQRAPWGSQLEVNPNVLAGGLVIIWPIVAALIPARLGSGRVISATNGRVISATNGRVKTWSMRLCLIAALILMTVVLVLTQSRGAFLALLAVGLAWICALCWPRVRLLVVVLSACVIVASLALSLWLGREGAMQIIDTLSKTGTVDNWSGRRELWSRAIYMIQDFPYTGIGLGTFDLVQPLLYPFFLHTGQAHHVHNLLLQVAVDLGLPGLIAYLALLMGSISLTWRLWTETRSRPHVPSQAGPWENGFLKSLSLGLLGSHVALIVHGLLDAAGWANKLAVLPWLVMGLTVASSARRTAASSARRMASVERTEKKESRIREHD